MASKRPPGKQQRRPAARVAAAARARQRRNKQRVIVTVSALAVVLAIIALLIQPLASSNDNSSSTSTTVDQSSTTVNPSETTAPMKSVKGEPCVAVSDPLPKGAPQVPVPTGPPPTALVKKDLKLGNGAVVKPDAQLTVDYIGVSCSTGKIFDSSYKTGQPASFSLQGVISGWQQGIPGMKVGGMRLLGIPPAMAYGKEGSPPDIAPDETLWFVVTIVNAK